MKKDIKKDVLIKIIGNHNTDGDNDTTEMFTVGKYYRENDHYYITYHESAATGFEGYTTTVDVDSDKMVSLTRRPHQGDEPASPKNSIVVERGIRHLCRYGTPQGDIMIGVWGERIDTNLKDNGGDVTFAYTLDVNSVLASENQVTIEIKEKA